MSSYPLGSVSLFSVVLFDPRRPVPAAAIIVVLLAVAGVSDAHASEGVVPTVAEEAPPDGAEEEGLGADWSISAGITVTTRRYYVVGGAVGGLGGLGGVGGLGSYTPISPGLMLEKRLSERLWLLARLRGGYSRADSGDHNQSSWSLGGGAGVRGVLTSPDAIVDVSATGVVGVSAAVSEVWTSTEDLGESESISVSASVGVTVARELVEGLSLAATVELLEFAWARGFNRALALGQDEMVTSEAESVSFALPLSPTIELRYEF